MNSLDNEEIGVLRPGKGLTQENFMPRDQREEMIDSSNANLLAHDENEESYMKAE